MEIITNSLPLWLPYLNIISSLIAVIVTLFLLKKLPNKRILLTIVAALSVVMLAGALFQANIIGLPLWIIFGTGGRILATTLLLVEAGLILRGS